jgi:excisionase family DNA binding protein
MSTRRTLKEHQLARALVAAHVPEDVVDVVLDAIDGWHEVIEEAERAIERAALVDVDAHLSVKQVAALFTVSDDAVYKLVAAGELPDRRVGGQIRIPASSAWGYLEANTRMHDAPERKPRVRRMTPADADTVKRYPWLKGA